METKLDMNVEKLVQQWVTDKAKDTYLRQRPYIILFHHLERLTDENVKSFFEEVKREGFVGEVYDNVGEVKHMADTYHIIGSCVRGDLIII